MCAIFGIVGDFDRSKAVTALRSMRHRGPDEEGVWQAPGIFLGHERLIILNPDAKQPMSDGDKWVVFNGEIYNYQDFGVTSDTAAILKAYPDFEKLDGMFAFALYDGEALYLARDIFGKKPLFYYRNEHFFIFSSEIKAILAYLGSYTFERKALSGYLSFGYLPNRLTFYKDIYKLLPGEVLRYDINNKDVSFTSLPLFEECEGGLQSALFKSVQKRLQGDFEVASLLSGGVDSSFVAAIAKQLQGHLATFSIGYKNSRYSELPYAKEVAAHIGSEHFEVYFEKEDFFETFHILLEHFDEPMGDSASVPLAFLFAKIKEQGFRVVLSGEGGDEIFLGYRQYFEFADLLRAKDLKYKNWLRNYFRSHFSPNKEWEWYKRVFEGETLFRSSSEVFTDLQKNLFLKQNVKDNESLEFLKPFLKSELQSFDFFTYIDLYTRLGLYLSKLDTTSMMHSIEARTPLLDKAIFNLAMRHPQRSEAPKYLLKKMAKKFLPDSIIDRKKKGFSYPHMEWLLQSDYLAGMEKINDETGFFKPDQLRFLIENAKRNRFSRHFWLVLSFLLWYKRKF